MPKPILFSKSVGFYFLLLLITIPNFSQQLSFPGAEGFGRFASGGRGGTIYHVTNLNDSGAGSFRDAVSQSGRYVVFDISGVINISSRIVIKKDITIAGQTAPGDGITIYGNGIALNGDSGNDVIRHIRVRMGKNGDSGKDAVGISEKQNYMFDHVSISWGRDGTLDVNGSTIDNLTFQDCIISQGINNSNHSTGGLMQSGKWSVIRSLYIDNKTRNPKARGTHEFINSVLYNWSTNGYIMGDTDGLSECNLIGNYFISGPASGSGSHITGTTPAFNVYAEDNWLDSNKDGQLNGTLLENYKTATVVDQKFNYPGVNNQMEAEVALKYVINNVGASLNRDEVDIFLINELLSYGTKGQIINTEDDNGIPNNVGTVNNSTLPTDTDGDAMPDYFEDLMGYDKNKSDFNEDADGDGYPNIEEYFNCLTCNCDVKMPDCPVLSSGSYSIKSNTSGLCLSNDEQNGVEQTACDPSSLQGWLINEVEPDQYTIKNIRDNSYLSYATATDGTALILTTNETIARKFSVVLTESQDYIFTEVASDLKLAISGGSKDDGADLILTSSETGHLFSVTGFTPTTDCAGVIDGEASFDGCGVCSGGSTGTEPCTGGIGGEDFCESGSIGVFENTNTGFLGTGYFNFDNQIGATATYKIYSQKAQSVAFTFRYANGGADSRPFDISVNGNKQITALDFPSTGDWTTWQETQSTLSLSEGANTLLLTATEDEGGPNLDLIGFEAEGLYNINCDEQYTLDCHGVPDGLAYTDDCNECVGGETGLEPCDPDPALFTAGKVVDLYPNPFTSVFTLQLSSNHHELIVYDLSGEILMRKALSAKGTHTIKNNWPAGIYLVNVLNTQGKVMLNQRVIKR